LKFKKPKTPKKPTGLGFLNPGAMHSIVCQKSDVHPWCSVGNGTIVCLCYGQQCYI